MFKPKFIAILITLLFLVKCTIPRILMAPKDVNEQQINSARLKHKVLIASSQSEYKKALIKSLINNYQDQPVHLKITGLDKLPKATKATNYDAIVVLNSCLAWGMEKEVSSFLKQYRDYNKIIILTTSGDSNWLPNKKGRNFDALSSASQMANLEELSGKIIERVNKLLDLKS